MKILMIPGEGQEGDRTTGISQVVHKYVEYLKKEHSVEFVKVNESPDLVVGHAGVTGKTCDVAILHGIYWTGDYEATRGEYAVNAKIAESVRAAREITVPSDWVKKTIERDLRISPTVINHGIEWDEWQEFSQNDGHILWNKNRMDKVCDPFALQELASRFPKEKFISTFAYADAPRNIDVIGKQDFDDMKKIVKSTNVYLSLVKETFGIGTLEAMASGVPVLGWNYGGNVDIVEHGVTGYLAEPENYNDLANGLDYCLRYRKILGENSRERAKRFTWSEAVDKLYGVLESANKPVERKVSVIIPTYNYADKLERSVGSVCEQTLKPHEIIVVDDGSKDDPEIAVEKIKEKYTNIDIKYVHQENSGVANARNTGFKNSTGEYICCLDPDDFIKPEFLESCVRVLEDNDDVYVAYTRLWYIKPDGEEGMSGFPNKYDYDKMLQKQNQVPTCNVARRRVWERLGGQRQRYAPMGAGSEDAEMWLRAGAHGMGAILATNKPMFVYSWLSGMVSGNKDYREVDFRLQHPYVKDNIHPFASLATPKNNISHPVFQYDEPVVSIIIPVAERHLKSIVDAIDSVDGQTFRKWEIVVIDDSITGVDDFIKTAYPFVTWAKTPHPESGAAVARNTGCRLAKSGLYLFLDADDEFGGEDSLSAIMKEYYKTGDIIYTDYTIKIKSDTKDDAKRKFDDRLMGYNSYSGVAYVKGKAHPYDCEKAQSDPDYNWCIVSCLVPKDIHNSIEGFDEKLEILEDVDYYKRLAKMGYCFQYIPEPFFVIDRTRPLSQDKSKKDIDKIFKKIKNKLERIENMACKGCGSRSVSADLVKVFNDSYKRVIAKSNSIDYNDSDFVRCKYECGMAGDHPVVGSVTGIKYGYKSSGDIFLVHRKDYEANQGRFILVRDTSRVVSTAEISPPPPPERSIPKAEKEPESKLADSTEPKTNKDSLKYGKIDKEKMTEPISVELLASLGASRNVDNVYAELIKLNITTVGLIPSLTNDQLKNIKGIGEATAKKLKENAVKYYQG